MWFSGFTRQLSTAVWVGSQGNPFPLSEYFGNPVFGSSVAAPVWKAFMVQAMEGLPALKFHRPELINVPRVIGLKERFAVKKLKELRLRVVVERIDSYLPKGIVTEQDPSAGFETILGTRCGSASAPGSRRR